MKGATYIRAYAGAGAVIAAAALTVPCFGQVAIYEAVILHSDRIPFVRSFGWGIGDGQQVGTSTVFRSGPGHALLWSGSAESFVDLHPEGFDASHALGVSGGRQVGFREVWQPELRNYATMWSGSASGWVDLHVPSFRHTRAFGIGGNQQVGAGLNGFWPHALLWRGNAASAVNLNPSGFSGSEALGTDGVQQVGRATPEGGVDYHAALWSGTAESFVDLNPPGAS
ncbi:MAG: hypothetical protein IH851_13190 [Armatimonadetes bacterium]|nr:hypothetical protein [Armatimonadota bacterium]